MLARRGARWDDGRMSVTLIAATLLLAAEPGTSIDIGGSEIRWLIWSMIGIIVVGAIGALSNLVNIARYFKSDPPLDQKFASKAELADLERRIDRDSVTIRDSLKEIFGQLRTINHSLGRLEGQHEKGD